MKIAVLSGKGGTGKTLVSVNLASVAGFKKESGSECIIYADCDVEEPNGHLFFKPEITSETLVAVMAPKFDNDTCISCRACVDFCKFNALAMLKKPLLFSEICHSCGGCVKVCPVGAITEVEKNVGTVECGISVLTKSNDAISDKVTVVTGIMNPGEASGTPIIGTMYEKIDELVQYSPSDSSMVVVDCPPGSACLAMDAIKDADFCVLVAEPTVFGAHNFAMVHELVRLFKKPFGAVLNKCPRSDDNADGVGGDDPSAVFCEENNVPVLLRIPFSHDLGELNSYGKILVREKDIYASLFTDLYEQIEVQYAVQTSASKGGHNES
ncbi:MAG TPA: 4Fe-4S binding protein [Treponemataceae bacterium]|nr:4Fe-4S binding protein [Treponemataceae bacterium]